MTDEKAGEAHKRWSTWRRSEAWAMAEIGKFLEEAKSRCGPTTPTSNPA